MKRCVWPSGFFASAACVIALLAQPLVALAQNVPPVGVAQPIAGLTASGQTAAPANTVNTDEGLTPHALEINLGQTIRFTNNSFIDTVLIGPASLPLSHAPLN